MMGYSIHQNEGFYRRLQNVSIKLWRDPSVPEWGIRVL